MTHTVAVYHLSVPKKPSFEKTHMLEFFSEGARMAGNRVFDIRNYTVVNSDVAVIQGWIADKTTSPHLKLRQAVINQQFQRKKYVVTADSNLFLYADINNPLHYLRYSFNGVFPTTGIYCDDPVDPQRWNQIQQDLNISLKDYRSTGAQVLICLQRNGGWSMGNQSVASWLEHILTLLRNHTDRPIVIRTHPGDRQSAYYLKPLLSLANRYNFKMSSNVSLIDDLKNSWAVVNHNSSPTVAAAIEGYPVFITDTARSQCKDIANTDLTLIENPRLPDRLEWIQRLAMCHWKFDELKSGEAWAHMRQFVRDTL
jgi:hypothetical protein